MKNLRKDRLGPERDSNTAIVEVNCRPFPLEKSARLHNVITQNTKICVIKIFPSGFELSNGIKQTI
jgi:hypothetical protein